MALSVPLSRFTSPVGGGSAFFVRPIIMRTTIVTLVLVAFVIGCSAPNGPRQAVVTPLPKPLSPPPFSTTGRLTKQQLDWFVKKAIVWMQVDYDVMPDGSKLTRGFIYGSTIDQSRPIECVQSEDGGTVTVKIPQHIEDTSEYWLVVYFDTHTGEVQSHGSVVVSKSV
jgi:hypothetical protein